MWNSKITDILSVVFLSMPAIKQKLTEYAAVNFGWPESDQ